MLGMGPGKKELLYRRMVLEDVDAVHALVQRTISTSYKDVYSARALDFFKRYHDVRSIARNVHEGHCILAIYDGGIAGVGELLGNNIRMVFVEPSLQGMGIGQGLMTRLQDQARDNGLVGAHARFVGRRGGILPAPWLRGRPVDVLGPWRRGFTALLHYEAQAMILGTNPGPSPLSGKVLPLIVLGGWTARRPPS